MKKSLQIILSAILGLSASVAMASPILAPGSVNQLSFNLSQNYVDSDKNGTVSSGDLLYGIFNVTRIAANGGTVWDANNVPGPGVDSLSGYYVLSVNSVTPLPTPWLAALSMGAASVDPNGIFTAADIASHTIVKLFTDTATPFDSSGGVADGIARATDGSLWATFGIDGGYWDALLLSSGIVQAGGGLNFITNNTGIGFSSQTNPSCASCPMTDLISNTVSTDNGTTAIWRYTGGNNATLATIPTPSTLLLWMAATLALITVRFSQRKILSPSVPY